MSDQRPHALQQIRARVREIHDMADSPERAHYLEDELYRDVLQIVADSETAEAPLAREALKAGDINFPRWYA